ncbi:MAG TPA: NAD(P)-dependent oxidoreductase [Candidatus Obscuribacterales bacterium]
MTAGSQAMLPEEILRAARFFPLMEHAAAALSADGTLAGVRVGWHCHLTWLTALAAYALTSAGAEIFASECNPGTTEHGAVECLRRLGVHVFLGGDGPARVLAGKPYVISDTGLALTSCYLESMSFPLAGACEITTSGIARLRALGAVPLPVVNINDGQLKTLIENFHGVGDGLIDALFRLTGKMWAGTEAAVVGYGRVGAGVAHYLRGNGAAVRVVERDPVRQLAAHYDGFVLDSLERVLADCRLVVTATGQAGLLGARQWQLAADGLLVLNVGHWPEEVDYAALKAMAVGTRRLSAHLEEFTLPGTGGRGAKTVLLAAGGSPVNVALLSGSLEPTLIHLTTEMLCLAYLVRAARQGATLPQGEAAIPAEVERRSALLALAALGLHEYTSEPVRLESRDRTC